MSTSEPDLSAANARIYLGRKVDDFPPHPGGEWTRFVCISDTHSLMIPIPEGNVLIHAGDISQGGPKDIQRMFEWFKTLPHQKKVIIAGNHDLCLDVDWDEGGIIGSAGFSKTASQTARDFVKSSEILQAGVCYLEHEELELELRNGKVWKIYGSPAAPRSALGSFQYETEEEARGWIHFPSLNAWFNEIVAIYSQVPADTEILVTHTPPYGTLDKTRRGKQAGCPILAGRLQTLGSCRLHVFGHIHEGHGAWIGGERISVNAAVVQNGESVVVDLLK